MTELTDLGRRNDELMTAKEADLAVIRDLDSQLKEYKRRYEQAKTELRSVKGRAEFISLTGVLCLILCSNISAVYANTEDG